MLELYFWTTDNGYKARQMVEESGVAHVIRPVDLTKREQHDPEFVKISPAHKIPAIVDSDGPGGQRITLCESGAILKYLAEKAAPALYPEDPLARIAVDQWFIFGSATFTTLAQQYGLFFLRFGEDVPPAKQHYEATLRDLLGVLDRRLGEAAHLAGDFSIADITCYPDVHIHGVNGIGLDDFPNVRRWHDAIEARPATRRAWGSHEADA